MNNLTRFWLLKGQIVLKNDVKDLDLEKVIYLVRFHPNEFS